MGGDPKFTTMNRAMETYSSPTGYWVSPTGDCQLLPQDGWMDEKQAGPILGILVGLVNVRAVGDSD